MFFKNFAHFISPQLSYLCLRLLHGCSVGRYPGSGGGLPGLPPEAASVRSYQHRPHHPESCQLCVAGAPHQRGHGKKLSHSLGVQTSLDSQQNPRAVVVCGSQSELPGHVRASWSVSSVNLYWDISWILCVSFSSFSLHFLLPFFLFRLNFSCSAWYVINWT